MLDNESQAMFVENNWLCSNELNQIFNDANHDYYGAWQIFVLVYTNNK